MHYAPLESSCEGGQKGYWQVSARALYEASEKADISEGRILDRTADGTWTEHRTWTEHSIELSIEVSMEGSIEHLIEHFGRAIRIWQNI